MLYGEINVSRKGCSLTMHCSSYDVLCTITYSSTASLRVVTFCCVNFETGEVSGILILISLGVVLFRRHFWLT